MNATPGAGLEASYPPAAGAAIQQPHVPSGTGAVAQQEPAAGSWRAEAPCEMEGWVRLEGKCLPPPKTRKVLVGGSEPQQEPAPPTAGPGTTDAEGREPARGHMSSHAAEEAPAAGRAAQPAAPRAKRAKAAERNRHRRRDRHVPWSRPAPSDESWNARAGIILHRGYGPYPFFFERSWDRGR
jgi:hypothetical protein